MKRSRCDAFDDDAKPCKVQRVDEHSTTKPLSAPSGVSPSSCYDGPCVEDVDLRRVMDEFIAIYERLDTTDDPLVKPNYSYTELVYLALLRSPNFCLPINEIYKYIQSKFQFFRRNTREHWRNAVRHSLSKTKCFTKIGVRRGPNSSGTYNRSMFLWTFYPSSIVNFARGDYRPSVDKESGTNTLRWGYYRINAGDFWDKVSVTMESKMVSFKHALAASPFQSEVFEHQVCILPASAKSVPQTTCNASQVRGFAPQSQRPLPTSQPTHSSYVPLPAGSNSPDVRQAPSLVTARPNSLHDQVCYSSPASYPQSNSPYQYGRPASYHGYNFVNQGQDSPSFIPNSSTPVQSTLEESSHDTCSHVTTHPVSWGSTPDILACAWDSARNTPSCDDSVSEVSWSSFHDSGVSSDFSSPDNTYFKSFLDGRQFHSPQNVFSPCFNPQRMQACQYRSSHISITSETTNHPQDTFNDVQLFPEVSLSSLLDMTSTAEHEAGVFEFVSRTHVSVKQEVTSTFVTSSEEQLKLPADMKLKSEVLATKVASGSPSPSTSSHGRLDVPTDSVPCADSGTRSNH